MRRNYLSNASGTTVYRIDFGWTVGRQPLRGPAIIFHFGLLRIWLVELLRNADDDDDDDDSSYFVTTCSRY
jgi:hypothetical protein